MAIQPSRCLSPPDRADPTSTQCSSEHPPLIFSSTYLWQPFHIERPAWQVALLPHPNWPHVISAYQFSTPSSLTSDCRTRVSHSMQRHEQAHSFEKRALQSGLSGESERNWHGEAGEAVSRSCASDIQFAAQKYMVLSCDLEKKRKMIRHIKDKVENNSFTL